MGSDSQNRGEDKGKKQKQYRTKEKTARKRKEKDKGEKKMWEKKPARGGGRKRLNLSRVVYQNKF